MKRPRLCAVDVDGTLVGPEKTVSHKNLESISQYLADGGQVLLASGRMHSSVVRYALELGLLPTNLILSYNGAMVKSVGGDLLFERPVPPVQAQEIVEYCRAEGLHLNYYIGDLLYVAEANELSDLYLERSGSPSIPVGDLHKFDGQSPTKLLIIDRDNRIDHLASVFQERFSNVLYVTKTDDEYLEFMADGVNKGVALAEVGLKLGIGQGEIVAFGDSFNDVEMLAWAGVGVAMSNGRDVAKAAANIVADNADWSAVGDVISSFD